MMHGNLVCTQCTNHFSLTDKIWKCHCGALLDIEFNAEFPIDEIAKRSTSIWRYKEAIPVPDSHIISFSEGFTSLEDAFLYNIPLLIKHDYLFPTSSFKDRGASVLISKISEMGIKVIVEDSSGNAGTSIAAYAAKAGIRCRIIAPSNSSKSKQNQIITYGAELELLKGDREKVATEALKEAENTYYASHSWNPFFFQGTKTIAFEISEQMGWKAPDSIIVPLGNGTLVLGVYLGFKDLQKAGIITRLPRIIAVQASECAPVYNAIEHIKNPEYNKSIAEGISVQNPVRKDQIIEAIGATEGCVYAASDNEINMALKHLYSKGYYVEPTSAVVVGALRRINPKMRGDTSVLVLTGHGLKHSFSQL